MVHFGKIVMHLRVWGLLLALCRFILCLFVTDETMVINVFCGVVSGVLSSSLANPTDVLKVISNAGNKP